MSEQKICPTCGTEYPLSERFCPRDGTALRQSNPQGDLLGTIVADRYHVIKKLGEGGMGTVYLAEHVKMGRKSALKVMNPGINTDADAIARFNREASNASRLSHPNICGIYDFGETPEGMIYLAMEFIEGSSLTALIEKTGSLPAPRCGSIIHQTADALQIAHDAGIVHRDLKPDNIMIAKNRDGSDLVKVVDFGIAKASSSDAQKVTRTGLVVGTPEYMSPEQLAGDTLDGRSDIYSLGLVAFNALTGTLPFPAQNVQEAMIMRLTDRPRTLAEMKPELSWPADLQKVMDKALERDAEDRYASAAQFGREFAAAVATMPAALAAEAGTLVIGAEGTTQLPPTRVSRASVGTQQIDSQQSLRPAEAAKRTPATERGGSNRIALFGGIGGVAVAAGVAIFIFTRPGPSVEPVITDPATQSDISGENALSQPDTEASADGTRGGNTENAGNTGGDPQNPRNTGSTGANPQNPDRTPETRPTPQNEPSSSVSEAEVNRKLENWRNELETGDPDSAEQLSRSILRELEPMLENLTGNQLDYARYVALLAYVGVDDDGAVCRVGRLMQSSSLSSGLKSTASQAMAGRNCQ